jgi:hypothetical protein
MKRRILFFCILLSLSLQRSYAQAGSDTLIYLLTCGPGTESYSVYGHSAIRIVYKQENRDWVYNWGVFDFDTPNFGLKFANGKLEYLLAVEQSQSFIQSYFNEKRSVISQKLNLSDVEKKNLLALIAENLKPQNRKYRYDFFYDNCSTRIRDLIEKALGDKLLYLPEPETKKPTFRSLISHYQQSTPWLKFGIDLLLGMSVDKEASYRDRMFLPDDLQKELSETVIKRDGKMIPLLQNPEQILESSLPAPVNFFLLSPAFIFTFIFIVIILLTSLLKGSSIVRWLDIGIFGVFSLIALLMIFLVFFSGHPQLRANLNILWINPLVPVCLVLLILKKTGIFWFRFLFILLVLFLAFHVFLPQSFNAANLPLLLILIVRTSVHSDFEWNPL